MPGEWRIVYTKTALKERDRAVQAGFRDRLRELIGLIREAPFANYPPYEQLKGDLSGLISRRINKQHRLVYQVYEQEHTVKIVSCWSHYESL